MAIKQSRGVTIGKGTPQRNEGQNGDITIRSSRRGLKMYVKQANMWHSVDLGIDLRQISNTVQNLERKVKELSTKRNNFPVVDKLMLKQAGGAAAVQIKNDAGAIAFRNSADSADITLKNPKFSSATTVGDDNNPAINTSSSNIVRLNGDNVNADFELRLLHTNVSTIDNMITFYQGGTGRWAMGYVGDSSTIFRINGGVSPITLNEDLLQLNTSGDLSVDGTVTSSNGVCGGTGNSGNAAIYDNSGTPALKTGITSAEVTALMADASGIAKGIAAFSSTDFSVSSGVVSSKYKQVFSSEFAGRYTLGTADSYITGYPGYFAKATNSGIHTGQDTGDVTLGVDFLKYCLMMPEDGTVTGFVSDCEWDTANGEVDVDLWKVDAMPDTGSALTSVALDHIARITFTDPSDTTYYKALADNGGLDGTAKVFTAGESLLVTGMSEDSSDGSNVYLRPVVTVVYDS